MKNILLILSSPRGEQSYSNQVARRFVDNLKARHPEASVVIRNVAETPLPHVGAAFVNGLNLPAERRNADEAQAIGLSDKLVDELLAADTIVLAAPMYNLGLPSTLKAWLDHVVRAGRTFSYSENGPVGLAKNKKAVLVVARGGIYSEGPGKQLDFQETYLRGVLGLIGIANVHVIRVEGVALGQDAVKGAMDSADRQSEEAVREIA